MTSCALSSMECDHPREWRFLGTRPRVYIKRGSKNAATVRAVAPSAVAPSAVAPTTAAWRATVPASGFHTSELYPKASFVFLWRHGPLSAFRLVSSVALEAWDRAHSERAHSERPIQRHRCVSTAGQVAMVDNQIGGAGCDVDGLALSQRRGVIFAPCTDDGVSAAHVCPH